MTVTAIALALLPGGAIGLEPGLVGGGGSILALPLLVQCDRFRADPRGDWHGSGSGGRDGQCDGQPGGSCEGRQWQTACADVFAAARILGGQWG